MSSRQTHKKFAAARTSKPTKRNAFRTTSIAPAQPPSSMPALFPLGLIFVLVSIVASGMLVQGHLFGLAIPGCGEGSPCAQAANAVIPGTKFPVASLGL